MLDVSLKVIL